MSGPRPKALVRTDNPTRYWLIVRGGVREGESPRHMPVALLGTSESLTAGGLLFDYTPWLIAGLGAVLFSALFWLPLVRGITRSVAQMTLATQQIAQGRFEVRVDQHRRDELGALGGAVNQMAGRLSGFVAGQKRFLGDIAHELCSPLAKLQVALGILDQRADEQQRAYIDSALNKAQLLAGLVNELLSFSKASLGASAGKLQPVLLRETAERAVAREKVDGVDIRLEVPDDLRAQAEPELLVRALSNLLRNAVRYAGHAGPIRLVARQDLAEVEITVTDSGPGVPESELARIFDPFYRLDDSRDRATGGVGLGLSIVKTCVESCRGTVICRNVDPSGLQVVIRLAAAQPTP